MEIERLDAQIELMTETLEYQKENGLLWDQVAQIMQGTPEQISNFITANSKEWATKSTWATTNDLSTLNSLIQRWVAHRDDVKAVLTDVNGKGVTVEDLRTGVANVGADAAK